VTATGRLLPGKRCLAVLRREPSRPQYPDDIRPTRATRRVLLVLLTGAMDLSVYPISRLGVLDRLQDAGGVTGYREEESGGTRQRFYTLTAGSSCLSVGGGGEVPDGRSYAASLLGLEMKS
jgi:hypothetical protein